MKCFVGIDQALTMTGPRGDASPERALGLISDAAIICQRDGRVHWIGPRRNMPSGDYEYVDLDGVVVLPGLVEAHTHIVFAGDRTKDYAARCAGESYEEVARRGGGIRLTVQETRAASVDVLVNLALPRLQSLLAHGVTTVEIKSGYGLTIRDELKMLEAIEQLGTLGPWTVIPTLLAAHVIPDEFVHDRAGYISMVCDELMPEVSRRSLAKHVDVFCDSGAFTLDETVHILEHAKALGFGLKAHAEQLSWTGASRAAARLGAHSVDHLEFLNEEDIEVLAQHGTCAVLLPGASLFLGMEARPPARRLLDHGVPVALSTDCNPGTCPSTHLPLMTTLGCSTLGMMPHEALLAITREAALASGLSNGQGCLRPGGPCDFVVMDVSNWRHIPYRLGLNPTRAVFVKGHRAYQSAAF